MYKIDKIETIDKVVNKWGNIGRKIITKDIKDWCLCMEQSLIFINSIEKLSRNDEILPLVGKILGKLIERDVNVKYWYDKFLIRKFLIENLDSDSDLNYDDYILSKRETVVYRIVKGEFSEEDIIYNLSNEITDDIVNRANGRCFIPFNFISDMNTIDVNGRITIEIQCMYGFL